MKFRMQALVAQAEPEELDIVPHLVRPRAVAAAALLGCAVAAIIVWSFTGRLPRQVTAAGLLTPDNGLSTVQSTFSGVVQQVSASPTQSISAGQPVATIVDPDGKDHTVTAQVAGRIVTVSVSEGQPVQVGSALITVEPGDPADTNLHAVLFAPSSKAGQIGPGMSVVLSVDAAPSSAFGLLRGKVESVGTYPITSGQALALLNNDLLVQRFVGSDAVQLITVTLQADKNTKSGYTWTTKHGPPFPLMPQSLLQGTVRVGDEHPVSLVFGH